MLVEQARELADGHAVAHRNRVEADERFEAVHQHRPFDFGSADRIGPIADDDLDVVACRRGQAVRHRIDVGIDAGADVLQVDDEHVHVLQHLGRGLARFAVKRIDGNVPAGVTGMARLDHVLLDVGPEPVLRPENDRQPGVRVGREPVDDVHELVVHGSGVTNHTDPASAQGV